MSIRIAVKQGQCIECIAYEHGFTPQTILDHPDNAKIKNRRREHNILKHGDVVVVPDRRQHEEDAATGKRHRYRRKGLPVKFNLVLEEGGEPRANEPYVLWIDGEVSEGETDKDGVLSESISPGARKGRLLIGEGENQEEFLLDFGYVDPINELSGIQGRLKNLGLYDGPVDGDPSEETTAAIVAFQASVGLESNGKSDDYKTMNALLEAHWS
ncbi:hypothetical protein DSCO28_38940 [Desulfosarcina ovata subsp. sediminis]|uniref:Peptidoglycan binding-like domain-containing protein n=1 Tax=Desulfosarcina ovata subsp. sediminis TaxID=885957 RepID=A0A5K7ZSZ2_9BACT|nr:peptidoglycan-binding domain-containing protein [Desulfosarcina ovata]BBO83328.1 hypothetical protein DSCO28_38940 [Desulfosarcina ovata subsp. sediminis]